MSGGRDEVRILCIDDDGALLSLSTDMLERADDAFVTASLQDPTEAVEMLTAEGPFDCVVCDYDMPRMTGLDVLEAVREIRPDLPFILYTGKGSEEIASEAISAGVTDYLQKGTGTEQYELLANRIRKYVDRCRANREYELTEQRYRTLVEQSMVGIGLSQDGVFEYVNPKFADVFGYSTEELVDRSVDDVVAPPDHGRLGEAIESRESGDVDSVHYVLTGCRKDGEVFEIEVNGSRVTYEGEPAVLGLVQPLAARRRAVVEADANETWESDVRVQLERALGELAGHEDVAPARQVIESALQALGCDETDVPEGLGTVALAERSRSTLSDSGHDIDLTVADSRTVVASESAIDRLFESLWEAWGALEGEPSATLSASADAFSVAFEPGIDDSSFEPPADPPAVGRMAELLDFDVYVSTAEHGGRTYTFRGVESA